MHHQVNERMNEQTANEYNEEGNQQHFPSLSTITIVKYRHTHTNRMTLMLLMLVMMMMRAMKMARSNAQPGVDNRT